MKTKILSALLLGLIMNIIPLNEISVSRKILLQKSNVNKILTSDDTSLEEPEGCTFMYIGKDVSETGHAMIARTGDTSNPMTYLNLKVTKRNEYANKVLETWHGFTWQMPQETYRFIGFPRSNIMGRGKHWEVSTVNEKNLGISATLTCYPNTENLQYDPYEEMGVDEDGIAVLLAATCTTAREAMTYLADVIDKKGSAESNAIMAIDPNETWYMEIYTGHQYVAIKLPDDKATTIGNEFMLNTLKDFSDEDIISSPKLLSLPQERGFAKFDGEGKSLKDLNLFETYARPLPFPLLSSDEEIERSDASHMRTWRGFNLFAEGEYDYYNSWEKLDSFFVPKKGKLGKDDIYTFMRDRYENLLDSEDLRYLKFKTYKEEHKLRCVGTETSYQVHIITPPSSVGNEITIDKELNGMGMDVWVAIGNCKYSPFIPINNCMVEFPAVYTNEANNYIADENIASYHYRRLNALANIDEEKYGKPISEFWSHMQQIWDSQYVSCWQSALKLIEKNKADTAKLMIQNFFNEILNNAIQCSDVLYKDLSFQYLYDQKDYGYNAMTFIPLIDIRRYAELFDYSYSINKNVITLTKSEETITIKTASGVSLEKGKISYGDVQEEDFTIKYYEKNYYGDESKLFNIFSHNGTEMPQFYETKYLNNKLDFLKWLIPVLILSIIIIMNVVIIIVRFKKRKKIELKNKETENQEEKQE